MTTVPEGPFSLAGKVAVITGAGLGIGAAIARVFAAAGADVALTARTVTDLESVAEDVRAQGRRAHVLPGDVNDLAVVAELVGSTVAQLGGIDIVVYNAGGSVSHPILDTRVEQLEASFHFNVSVPFELSRLAVPHLLARGGGVIVNVGSVAGRKAVRGTLTHSLTKAAVAQLTRLMAADLAPRIRVNAVLPGAVETAALRRYLSAMDPDVLEGMVQRTPMRRNGVPDDIAHAALYLAAPASSWVTGKLLEVDGNADDDLIPKHLADL